MKVLLIAFACAPGRGSEPGLAYGLVERLAIHHQIWVLTNGQNRPLIEAESKLRSLPETVRFIYVEPAILRRAAYSSTLGHYLYYLAWQVAALKAARRLQWEVGFDLVHHLTYVNGWFPSLLGFVGPPFIWTAGNLERTPWPFLLRMSWRGRLEEGLRNLAILTGGALARWITGRRAALILSASPPERWGRDYPVVHFPMGGLTPEDLSRLPEARPQEGPFRILSVGRMLALKGFDLGLQAFARLHQEFPESEYWFIGDGPERPRLEVLARRLGISGAVRFQGWKPREEVFQCLAQASVLLHPSLHESFGYTVLEALGAGVPVICLDVGGPAVLVNDQVGIRIPPRYPEQVARDLHKALCYLARDRQALTERGRRARQWVREAWSWEKRVRYILGFYEAVYTVAKALPDCSSDFESV